LILALGADFLMVVSSPQPASAHSKEPAQQYGGPSYLELSIQPSIATVGDLLTLYVTYHNIGEPLLYPNISPCENVAYEPLIADPCDNLAHLFGYSEITFRALNSGVVTFHAGATGEVWDDSCQCWVWGGGSDNGPAIVTIVDTVWKEFLPVLQH
jgi:hypothetical protein